MREHRILDGPTTIGPPFSIPPFSIPPSSYLPFALPRVLHYIPSCRLATVHQDLLRPSDSSQHSLLKSRVTSPPTRFAIVKPAKRPPTRQARPHASPLLPRLDSAYAGPIPARQSWDPHRVAPRRAAPHPSEPPPLHPRLDLPYPVPPHFQMPVRGPLGECRRGLEGVDVHL